MRTTQKRFLIVMACAAFTACATRAAEAVPPGRAWLPVNTYLVPGHSLMIPDRLDVDLEGLPKVIASVGGGVGMDVYGLHWADTTWAVSWQLGRGTFRQWPVNSPPGHFPMIWAGTDIFGPETATYHWLVMAEETPTGVAQFDTVSSVGYPTFGYAAAITERWRWAVASDNVVLRAFSSDEPNRWMQVAGVVGDGERGVTVAALDDSTALVASSGISEGLTWGRLAGSTWIPGGHVPTIEGLELPGSARLRPRPSGGLWLVWASDWNHMTYSTYRDGMWAPPESLSCAYSRPFGHYTKSNDLSRDGGEFPVVAWSADDFRTLVQTVCVCIPTDSGFTVGDELEGSEDGVLPVVARDRNEDVWVAWYRFRQTGGMVWTHTYTKATTSTPRILSNRALRGISWMLSEPAPETWWAVLRSRNGGQYEQVARVRAGASPNMSWIDTSPAGGTLRYKVRRESVDTRYLWESPPGHWPPVTSSPWTAPPIELGLRIVNGANVALEVTGVGVEPVELEIFDLQGRRVRSERLTSSEADTIRLELGASTRQLAPGIYFARAHDENGRVSPPAKLVILR